MKKAADRVASLPKQLLEQFGEAGQETLAKLIRSQHEINSITAAKNFILDFRFGVRLMAECMDENDGDIRKGGELWQSAGRPATAWCASGTTAAERAAS
nr:DUF6809 family protein [uncultured Oscillibacter sp.]